MRSWAPWVAERRAKLNKPYAGSLYMSEDGPIPLLEAIERYGAQVLSSPFARHASANRRATFNRAYSDWCNEPVDALQLPEGAWVDA